MSKGVQHVVRFEHVGQGDVARVGGKNASLGEMVRHLGKSAVQVPPGFATTADAYWHEVDDRKRHLRGTQGRRQGWTMRRSAEHAAYGH